MINLLHSHFLSPQKCRIHEGFLSEKGCSTKINKREGGKKRYKDKAKEVWNREKILGDRRGNLRGEEERGGKERKREERRRERKKVERRKESERGREEGSKRKNKILTSQSQV